MATAFYAPLKPPDHAVPSGDREMARALFGLLQRLGERPFLASRLRSFDREGDGTRQERLERLGRAEARRIVRRVTAGRLPHFDLWLTYHGYHKAPDHLGPALAARFAAPYVAVEASIAGKQSAGPWATGHAATLAALGRADLVVAMTAHDAAALAARLPDPTRLARLRPFIDTAPFAALASADERARARAALAGRLGADPGTPWLIVVAMMRNDVKQRSYALLAAALRRLRDRPWQLVVAGDGPARPAIAADLATLGAGRVHLLGTVPRAELPALYAACDLLVWPALREAYGLVLLEAQATGTPVVAGAEGGVPEVVADGVTGLLTEGGADEPFAVSVAALLADEARRRRMGAMASRYAVDRHDAAGAALRLGLLLGEARRYHAARAASRDPGAAAMR